MTRFRWPLLGATHDREARLARAEIADERAAEHLHAAEVELALGERSRLALRVPRVEIGRTPGGTPCILPIDQFDSTHLHVTGATGSGKSVACASLVDGLTREILAGARLSVIVIVMQGFLGDMVLGSLGRRLVALSPGARQAFIQRLHVVRFHRGASLVPWNPLAREASVSIIEQAAAFAEVIEQLLGARFGSRQELAITMLLALAIEAGMTLPALRAELDRVELLVARATRSAIPALRLYFPERFLRESRASLDGIRSRLDLICRSEVTAAVLQGPGTLPFADMLAPGRITVLDFGGAPLAFEGSRTLAGLALQLLAFEIFNPRRRRDGFTVLLGDELQQALSPATIRVIDNLLTTARAMRVGVGMIHQSLSQLPRELEESLATNVRYRFLFRTAREEARRVTEYLPEPADPTEARAQERLVGRLPTGRMFFTDRLFPGGPVLLDAPRFAPPSLDALPASLREALERGALGQPRDELLARARTAEREIFARIEATPQGALASTPDLVTPRRRR